MHVANSSRPNSGPHGIDRDLSNHQSSKNEIYHDEGPINEKLIIVMVGLPARGKSYVAKKLCRYLTWRHHRVRIFNVGDRRRKLSVAPSNQSTRKDNHSASFFDPDNAEAGKAREAVALETLDHALDYLLDAKARAHCAIFDATNSTVERRMAIVDRVRRRREKCLGVLFVESHCYDERLLEMNMRLKLSGPDYKDLEPGPALEDFKLRVKMYEKKYVPLGDHEERHRLSFCQMVDVGRKFTSHNIVGHLASEVATYLQHFNLQPRQIWLTRNAESDMDVTGMSGADPGLSLRGVEFSQALSTFIDQQQKDWRKTEHSIPLTASHYLFDETADDPVDDTKEFSVWTSMMRRSVETARFFDKSKYKIKHTRMLDDVRAGVLQENNTPFTVNGYDSHLDLLDRINSVLLDIERTTDHVLVIGHSSVVSTLLQYFTGQDVNNLHIPLGTVYRLEPEAYGATSQEFCL